VRTQLDFKQEATTKLNCQMGAEARSKDYATKKVKPVEMKESTREVTGEWGRSMVGAVEVVIRGREKEAGDGRAQ
jgi:hypothetical protein